MKAFLLQVESWICSLRKEGTPLCFSKFLFNSQQNHAPTDYDVKQYFSYQRKVLLFVADELPQPDYRKIGKRFFCD